MFGLFRKSGKPASAIPPGKRCYAIGDIHGRLDLLTTLISMLERDNASRPPMETYLVLLGDLIDRGPDSKGVIDFLMHRRFAWAKPIFLLGNHEEAFLAVLDGELDHLDDWLRYGGLECLQSYGMASPEILSAPPPLLLRDLRHLVPQEHIDFLSGFYDSFALGKYLFVHAGIRPGIPLEEQDPSDLRWIRHDFLNDRTDHGVTVVHGHTVVEQATVHANRIAIDTGAYVSGRLSAVRLEGMDREFIVAEQTTATR